MVTGIAGFHPVTAKFQRQKGRAAFLGGRLSLYAKATRRASHLFSSCHVDGLMWLLFGWWSLRKLSSPTDGCGGGSTNDYCSFWFTDHSFVYRGGDVDHFWFVVLASLSCTNHFICLLLLNRILWFVYIMKWAMSKCGLHKTSFMVFFFFF